MMKKLYGLAWVLLTFGFVISAFAGALDMASMLFFSLSALALVYGLALWTVFVNTRERGSRIN